MSALIRPASKSAFLNSSASVPPYCQIDSPDCTCLYRPRAPTRSANAAVRQPTAAGSTNPGFCGSSSSCLTRSQPAATAVAAIHATTANRARFLFIDMSIVLGWGSVLQIESERDVGRRRTGVEVLSDFVPVHAVILLGIDAREARPGMEIPKTDDQRGPLLRVEQISIDALREHQRSGELAELPELRRNEVTETRSVGRTTDARSTANRNRSRLHPQRRRGILTVSACLGCRRALEVVPLERVATG